MKARYLRVVIVGLTIGVGLITIRYWMCPIPLVYGQQQGLEETTKVTRWIDPTGRQPITYDEWLAQQPIYRNRLEKIQLVKGPTPPQVEEIRVLTHSNVHTPLYGEVYRYVMDLRTQGYTVEWWYGSFSSPQNLRDWLITEYNTDAIEGCVLIGDWPVPWYEMDDDFDDTHSELPIDLYYMDLDGSWGDADLDGIFDSHTANTEDVGPEIWIGRLTFSPLTYGGATEVSLLKTYFDKNHRHRVGQLSQPTKGLAYNDDDWDSFDTCEEMDLCNIYGASNVTIIYDAETTTESDYKTRAAQNREFIHVMSHGSPGGHGFYRNSQSVFDWISSSEIISLDPHAHFYNLFVCSSCRYVATDYVGGWYINGTYGLAAVGSTKTGSMLYFPDFYDPLASGKTLGQAFKEWFDNRAAGGFEQWERRWFYGMTLLGDPALGPKVDYGTKTWTVLVYLDGDNNLEGAGIDDLNEMEAAGSDANVNIVVQFDRIPGYDSSNGDWTTCKRFYVTQDPNGYDSTIVSTELEDLGECNMGDPNTLINFANWAIDNYPAQHYALVLWDHGSGWKILRAKIMKGVVWDDTDGGDYITTPELRAAMQSIYSHYGAKVDIVGFDACLMGMTELDYELTPHADYRVGSEEVEPGDGWDYEASLTWLVGNPTATAQNLAAQIVTDYGTFYGSGAGLTLSAVDLSTIKTPSLATDLDTLATTLINNLSTYMSEVAAARGSVKEYYDPDFIDLYHFAQLIYNNITDPTIQAAAQAVMNAVSSAVVANYGGTNDHGISIYFPYCGNYLSYYDTDVLLSQDTNWNDFLQAYCHGTPAVFRVTSGGDVRADGAYYGQSLETGSADVAEWVSVSEPVAPGDVLELDPTSPGQYRKAGGPCSTLVAGVVSTEPGVVLGASDNAEGRALLALLGIVSVKVTNEGGPIQPGDLLVTSSTPGHAMRWDPGDGSPCDLVGKALEPWESGRGEILVLLMH